MGTFDQFDLRYYQQGRTFTQDEVKALLKNFASGFQAPATPATNPGTPTSTLIYPVAPGTYPNFKDALGASIVVPQLDAGKPVVFAYISVLGAVSTLFFTSVSIDVAGKADAVKTFQPISLVTLRASSPTDNTLQYKIDFGSGLVLLYYVDGSDTTTTDDGITTIVTTNGKRVKLISPVADGGLSPRKTSFLVLGKNLFNPNGNDVKPGWYVAANTGVATANSGYNLTGYIPVTPGVTYFLSYKNQIAWFDGNKGYLNGDSSVNAAGAAVVAPAGAAYLRCSVTTIGNSWANFQVEINNVATAYESHRRTLKSTEYSIYADHLSATALAEAQAGITVNTAQLANKAVSIQKLNFLQSGKNLFDPGDADYTVGYYVSSSNGTLIASATYNSTGYIPVTAALQYAISATTGSNQYAWFDANKAYISGGQGSNTSTVLTAPAGAAYLRWSITASSQLATFQVEQGAAATAYEAFYLVIKPTTGQKLYADNLTAAGAANLSALLSINTAQLVNGAVTKDKVNFLNPGKNKFNINDSGVIIGKYLDGAGNETANASYNITGYMPVGASATYTVSYKHTICYYTASKVFISSDSLNNNQVNKQVTTPANAAYMRCTVSAATYWASFQVELGSSATGFEAFVLQLADPAGTQITIPGSTVDITAIQAVLEVNRGKSAKFAIAPKLYVAKGTELAVYYETISKYFDEYVGKIDIAISGATIGGRAAKITPSATGTIAVTITIYNEKFDVLTNINSSITVSDPATTTAVKIMNIGDSYTLRSGWVNKLLAAAANAGVTFLGLRTTTTQTTTTPVNCEGRGGSSLANYFSQDYSLNGNTGIYMPFYQPTATYLYYGRTDFWITANTSYPDGQGGTTIGTYDSGNYLVRNQYNATTGFRLNPNVNDLMYDAANATYKYWNGSAWTATSAPASWAFSFAKYRTAWGIAQPDVIHLLFGTNDWSNVSETQITSQWAAWKTNMDALIASVKADSPNCKIIIGIPNAPGKIGAEGGIAFYERRKRAYWYHASQIIANYSGREVADKIYVADYNASIDREYGFANSADKPFADYTGGDRERIMADAVHISADGFNQMGNIYLGLIQALR